MLFGPLRPHIAGRASPIMEAMQKSRNRLVYQNHCFMRLAKASTGRDPCILEHSR